MRFYHQKIICIILVMGISLVVSGCVPFVLSQNNIESMPQNTADTELTPDAASDVSSSPENEAASTEQEPYISPVLTSTPAIQLNEAPAASPTPASLTAQDFMPVQTSIIDLPEGVTWTDNTCKYVWFGSYPQTLLTGEALTAEIINADYDSNGTAQINKNRYKRLSKNDLPYVMNAEYEGNESFAQNSSMFFDWTVNDYAYFIFEPVQWRVLSQNGSELFLLAELSLDAQAYHVMQDDVSWKDCSLRSWLNGYDETQNMSGIDYSAAGAGFLSAAFTSAEEECILEKELENNTEGHYGITGESPSVDKIFLLSYDDAGNTAYGFCYSQTAQGDGSGRVAYNTEYALVRGARTSFINGSCIRNSYWWLRSLSSTYQTSGPNDTYEASGLTIFPYGKIDEAAVSSPNYAVRPALVIRLDESTQTAQDTPGSASEEPDSKLNLAAVISDLLIHNNIQETTEDYLAFLKLDAEIRASSVTSLSDRYDLSGINISPEEYLLHAAMSAGLIDSSTDMDKLRQSADLLISNYTTNAFDSPDYTYYVPSGADMKWQFVLRGTRKQITREEYEQMYAEYIAAYAEEHLLNYEDVYRIAYSSAETLPDDELALYLDFVTTTPAVYAFLSTEETYVVELSFNRSEYNEWAYHQLIFQVTCTNDAWSVSQDGELLLIPAAPESVNLPD